MLAAFLQKRKRSLKRFSVANSQKKFNPNPMILISPSFLIETRTFMIPYLNEHTKRMIFKGFLTLETCRHPPQL